MLAGTQLCLVHFVLFLVTKLSLTLCNPVNCSLLSSFVHGIFQARILEWVAYPFSRGSSRPKDWTWVSCIACRFITNWPYMLSQIIPRCPLNSVKIHLTVFCFGSWGSKWENKLLCKALPSNAGTWGRKKIDNTDPICKIWIFCLSWFLH